MNALTALVGGYDLRKEIAAERLELANLLRDLSGKEWETETLCAGWRVRDVVAHLLYDATPPPIYLYDIVRAGGSTERLNDRYLRKAESFTTAELLTRFELSIGSGFGATTAPRLALYDVLVHHQDIRRPLGRPRTVPERRLRAVLDYPDPFVHPTRRMRGLRFEATDINWTNGDGAAVRGPAEAIVMAIAGRPTALRDLTGDGVEELTRRLT
ncbi:maleylpyruvate isomerase family mycothiol-dependent enzyme [Antrihabitans sp. YC3-6]|uniref:Maleylpyruvate isomerase family mycothiol-dependent enzyme n=1 Tax=Antrihabitans stalagmiti TaxID=2799499 RepID=A0A934U5Z6_9NOCA|nr:maleylpyruvate isomerase family mycothiol-dependent enzyme [Antrihabitans stalagmiti]MBJ8342044.1 maleylpyruvate isomerase family mycothiol-dependent enzyme [Antrihabitans stalagmiti]